MTQTAEPVAVEVSGKWQWQWQWPMAVAVARVYPGGVLSFFFKFFCSGHFLNFLHPESNRTRVVVVPVRFSDQSKKN
jgi:hypothetical protein